MKSRPELRGGFFYGLGKRRIPGSYETAMEGVWNGYGTGMEPPASKPAPATELRRS